MLGGYGIDGAFEQGRGDHLNRSALKGGLTGKLGLNLGFDVNGDGQGVPSEEILFFSYCHHPTLPRLPASTVSYNITSFMS